MSLDPRLRELSLDLPTRPQLLGRLAELLHDESADAQQVGRLIETDMALASAVLRTVNSAMFGITRRVETVHEAVQYLGMSEVAAVTYQMGLRSVFPSTPELEEIWSEASRRSLFMGRMANLLRLDPWLAHSAGLFEDCGKAVLVGFDPEYGAMLPQYEEEPPLVKMEMTRYGVGHDVLGAALCESWGLSALAADAVRLHVAATAHGDVPEEAKCRWLVALMLAADAWLEDEYSLRSMVEYVAPQANLDRGSFWSAAEKVSAQLGA
ncbi:MAG: HDOD domain-containing protein [Burkholderiaceae bacterium]|nr:MAG: HDOD domain-containing protein [Burkholderiaceae bacterium]